MTDDLKSRLLKATNGMFEGITLPEGTFRTPVEVYDLGDASRIVPGLVEFIGDKKTLKTLESANPSLIYGGVPGLRVGTIKDPLWGFPEMDRVEILKKFSPDFVYMAGLITAQYRAEDISPLNEDGAVYKALHSYAKKKLPAIFGTRTPALSKRTSKDLDEIMSKSITGIARKQVAGMAVKDMQSHYRELAKYR